MRDMRTIRNMDEPLCIRVTDEPAALTAVTPRSDVGPE